MLLDRDGELATLAAACAAAAAGRGAFVLVEGPAGIGKTSLLGAACAQPSSSGLRVLTARGLALERDFPYGIARQLIEPVCAAAGTGEWDALLDGAAGLAARVFDGAEAGAVEDDIPHATTHGLYWLVANLAARRPLMIVVDDLHWADPPSLRWLSHLAARIDGLPVALLAAVRSGPDEPVMLDELRACPACTRLRLGPLGLAATTVLLRERLGRRADAELCQAGRASTGGNPFLLESLAGALRAHGAGRVEHLGPQPVAQAVLRRVGQLGEGAGQLTRALAILGGPAPLRHAAALSGLDLAEAARLADQLRAADVLAAGSTLSLPIRSCGRPSTRRSPRANGPWPTPGRRCCSTATAPTASASRCTCCAASRTATPTSLRCCARPRRRPAAAVPPVRPPATFAARSKSHPTPRSGPRCCWNWDSPWPATAVPRRWRSCGRQSSWPGPVTGRPPR